MNKTLQTQAITASAKPSFTLLHSRVILRKCDCGGAAGLAGGCEKREEKKLTLQRKAVDHQAEDSSAPPIVPETLRSRGHPLAMATRSFMEPRFGHDFSRVRVHADAKAAESARAVNALAYTVGDHIVFGDGAYAPHSEWGKLLIAHELSHVVQQEGRTGGPRLAGEASLRIAPLSEPAALSHHQGHRSLLEDQFTGSEGGFD